MTEKDMLEKDNNFPEFKDNTDIHSEIDSEETPDVNNEETETGSPIEELQEQLKESKDKYVRLVAEFDNFRKRNAKERVEMIQTAGKEVITELLDVLDDCDRAQKQLEASDDAEEIKEGVMLVFNKLRNKLQARGVKAMETIEKDFNPDLHEAITEIPAPTPDLKGKIIDEVMKGYYLNDKIIRHAKVVIGK